MKKQFESVLKEKFGLSSFREGQVEAMQALFDKNRLLCIQPTGYGKSLLYQVPSCLLGGTTLVISPLLALIRDQIEQLKNRFNITATSINSDQTEEENALARQALLDGAIQILFISPEQLDHIDRFNFLLKLPIKLFVIDEAHCISTWGHDFRPSYRMILKFCQALKDVNPSLKILGLTATADARVEKDIVNQLSSPHEPIHVWREKMDRANLHLSVIAADGIAQKLVYCEKLLESLEGHGLIYCSTRENTELVADYLEKQGLLIIAYHAGLESEEKRVIQEGFARGVYRLVAATTALGMGIDKKDLRFIIHFDIAGSITAYYQEIGRSGRDGNKAEGILIYDRTDRKIHDYFINSALPTREDFEAVLNAVKKAEAPLNLTSIKRETGFPPTRVTIVIAELIEQEFLIKISQNGKQLYQIDKVGHELDLSRYKVQHQVKSDELNKMLDYAEQKSDCRMATLRKVLGDTAATPCGRCDLCLKTPRVFAHDQAMIDKALNWLSKRPVPISAVVTNKISAGLSLYDGKLRTPPFLRFMRHRAVANEVDLEILSHLVQQAGLLSLNFSGIITLPSRTWLARDLYGKALADALSVPYFGELLSWETLPQKRQGEWFNNDQRRHNVHEKMQSEILPKVSGDLLLLDDYIGTGATLKEAARALRKRTTAPLIPLTIACVKWHLGKPGFV